MEIQKCYGRTTDGQTDRDKYKRHLCVEKERVVESFLKVGGCDKWPKSKFQILTTAKLLSDQK